MKQLTIVLLAYNHSKFIIECLDSIVNQTFKDYQLIIIDDYSTDNSVELIKDWLLINNIQATLFLNNKNIGKVKSLNQTFDSIIGKYVKIMSADDYFHPNYLEETITFLEESENNYGMVCTNTWIVDQSSYIISDLVDYNQLLGVDKEKLKELLIFGNRIAALTVLMKTNVLLETGYYNEEINVEDYDRWLRINEKYWIGYIPKKLTYYRIHSFNDSKINCDIIEEECLYLRILYDKKCLGYEQINIEIEELYLRNNISKRLIFIYLKYRKRSLFLSFFLKYNLNVNLYKFFKRI